MQRRRIRNLNNTAFLALLLWPCFKPGEIEYLSIAIDRLFDYARIIVLIIALFLYFYQGRISHIFLAITAMQALRIFSTFLNDGNYWGLLVSSGSVLTYCMIIEMGIRENARALFRATIIDLSVLCVLNLLTVLLFPDGMYKTTYTQNWLLGYDNIHILFILPLLCFYSMYAGAKRTPFFRKLCFWAIISASVYITWSATSVVGCTLFLVILFMNELSIRPRVMNPYTYVLVTLAGFLMIFVIQNLDIFRVLIVDILHKDMTFTGRITIWNAALYLIAKKPFLGYGVADVATNMARLHGVGHTHNYFLQIAYEGGIVSLICYAVIILMICKKLYEARGTGEGFLLSGMLFCFLLMFLDEAYSNIVPFYGCITCMYYTKEISQGLSRLHPARRLVIHHTTEKKI